MNQTPLSRFGTPPDCDPQLTPPSEVRRITLFKSPTAVTVSGSVMTTAMERITDSSLWIEVCHVPPPSVVRRIVPPSPTAVPVLASAKDTA